MNEHDEEKLSSMAEEMGYIRTDSQETDLFIFETCCVRENAEEKLFGHLGSLKTIKKNNKDMIIALGGCMMQEKHVVEKIKKSFHFADIVFGTHNIHTFPEQVYKSLTIKKRVFDVWENNINVVENIPMKRNDTLKAWVDIIYGCNNFCSYCIVPYVRGRERSRLPEEIVSEVKQLVLDGCKEITLLGQNVNSYGNDFGKKTAFPDLLKELNKIEGLERIRFMTPHPKDLSDELIYALRDLDKVCEHLHLPFQSGSTRVLEKMNRKYTKEHYFGLIDKIKKEIPDIALTTDIIVGFPGETEEDFQDTLDIVQRVRYDSAYMFIYSQRVGTVAAKMENQIEDSVKKERFNRLLEMENKIIEEINLDMVGKKVEILVEGRSRNNENMLTGRTRTNKIVNFEANSDLTGELVNVEIIRSGVFWLEGKII